MVKEVRGQLVDLWVGRIFPAAIVVEDQRIREIRELDAAPEGRYLLPGFVDSHIHIESSMLVPHEFARLATVQGTVATVSDPHEIANVLGLKGVKFMVENAKKSPLKVAFGAPSCVPATCFETAGASLSAAEIDRLFREDELKYLSEVMNYPGVIHRDPELMEKIAVAQKYGRVVDGHSPGVMGGDLEKYASAGISTDHECFTLEEGLEKLRCGMRVLIREGSAAKNFEALHSLITSHPSQVMLCSDDKHPDDLLLGHINQLASRAIEKGHDLFDVLRCACINPVEHYGLDVGLLREGDLADFIVVEDLERFRVLETFINGELIVSEGKCLLEASPTETPNCFSIGPKEAKEFALKASSDTIRVIEAIDREIVTGDLKMSVTVVNGDAVADAEKDLAKIAVVNRYGESSPAVAFIKGFGLKRGALASSVAHDSHNIVAVGMDDQSLAAAVNAVVEAHGGVSVCDGDHVEVLPLPVAGLMSDREGTWVADRYSALDRMGKDLGSTLQAPFMTLSFMALLVIPSLKLSDKGLFDGKSFSFCPLFPEEQEFRSEKV